jgi:hypothetical protein
MVCKKKQLLRRPSRVLSILGGLLVLCFLSRASIPVTGNTPPPSKTLIPSNMPSTTITTPPPTLPQNTYETGNLTITVNWLYDTRLGEYEDETGRIRRADLNYPHQHRFVLAELTITCMGKHNQLCDEPIFYFGIPDLTTIGSSSPYTWVGRPTTFPRTIPFPDLMYNGNVYTGVMSFKVPNEYAFNEMVLYVRTSRTYIGRVQPHLTLDSIPVTRAAPAPPTIANSPTNTPTLHQIWYINATGRVNIRACPGTNCEIVTTMQPGEAIRVLGAENDWVMIELSR